MFRLLTVALAREKNCLCLWTETKRHPSPDQIIWTPTSNWPKLTTDRLTTSKSANLYIYISKFRILFGWCHLAMLLRHLKLLPKCLSCIYFPNQTCDKRWLHFDLHFSCWGALVWTFQLDLHFRLKISANLTVNRKTRGLTKPDDKEINHHGNWVISWSTVF